MLLRQITMLAVNCDKNFEMYENAWHSRQRLRLPRWATPRFNFFFS